jgi:hypothetical protein
MYWLEIFLGPGNTDPQGVGGGVTARPRKAGRATGTHHTQTHQLMGGGGWSRRGGGASGQVFSGLLTHTVSQFICITIYSVSLWGGSGGGKRGADGGDEGGLGIGGGVTLPSPKSPYGHHMCG